MTASLNVMRRRVKIPARKIGRARWGAIFGNLNERVLAPFSNDAAGESKRSYGMLSAFAVPMMQSVADGAQLTFDCAGSLIFRFR